jgi:hypothetical protein
VRNSGNAGAFVSMQEAGERSDTQAGTRLTEETPPREEFSIH